MIKNLTKKIALAALLIGAGAIGVTYAASSLGERANVQYRTAGTTSREVTATWALGVEHSSITADVSIAGALTATCETGSDLTESGTETTAGGTLAVSRWAVLQGAEGNIPENGYVAFTVTPTASYKPTSIAFNAINLGWGDGRFQVVAESGETTQILATAVNPGRSNGGTPVTSADGCRFSYDITDIEASTEPVTVKIYLYSRNNQTSVRRMGLANVVISGVIVEEETPSDYAFNIPGTLDLASTEGAIVASGLTNSGGELSYVTNGSTLTFKDVNVTSAGEYKCLLPLDYSYGDGTLKIEVANTDGTVEAVYDGVLTKNPSAYYPVEFALAGKITEGLKNVTFTFGRESGYVCNARSPEFVWVSDGNEPEVPADGKHIPGFVSIADGAFVGSGPTAPRHESKGPDGSDNVGYIKHESVVTFNNIICAKSGVYDLNLPFSYNNGGTIEINITDVATGAVEATASHTFVKGDNESAYPVRTIALDGEISEGEKTIVFTFLNEASSGWLGNFATPEFVRVANHAAVISGVSVDGVETGAVEGYDWNIVLPQAYAEATTTIAVESAWGVVSASAVSNGNAVEVTKSENGGFTIPTPEANGETIVTFTIEAEGEGVVCPKPTYTVRVYRIGGVVLTGLTVDGYGVDATVVETLNGEEATASLEGNIYTAVPVVEAMFIDGTKTIAKGVADGSVVTYSFAGTAGDVVKQFTFTVEGVHAYTPAENDETVSIRYDSANNKADGTWSNGLYTFVSCNDGWGGTQFKMKSNVELRWEVPADVVVKQFKMMSLFDNYAAGRVDYVTSEGATVYVPTNRSFEQGSGSAYDLVVNLEGHQAGTPIVFRFDGGSQPVAWFDFVYERQALTSAPVLKSISQTPTENANHAVVSLQFDREMSDAVATVNGSEVKAEGGSSVLKFSLWNLAWNADNVLTLPAGAVEDVYGNVSVDPILVTVTVGSPLPVEAALPDYVVGTVEELRAAVAEACATNARADAKRIVIFMKNGDYNLGSDVTYSGTSPSSPSTSDVCLGINRAYNISLIGESAEGVVIHGTRTGISNPIFSTRYSGNIYMQDFTLRNDLDFAKSTREGVAVAHYGGDHDIMVNVILQSQQDTQVTGSSGYYLNCTIHGSVDYICGGGEHFYDRCKLVQVQPGAITAPSTSPSLRHGYVFQNCEISGTAGYTLGRPWQNEPRAFFLNTVMHSLPANAGWAGMSSLPTHFYEYNSMDAAGNPLDLSARTNSPTSTNSYSPILPEEYAPYFIVENVLGGDDSWLPTENAEPCAAPRISASDDGDAIIWEAVDNASGYAVFVDGKYALHTTDSFCNVDDVIAAVYGEAATYSVDRNEVAVRATNRMGALGEVSENVVITGIDSVVADDNERKVEYYNLQGVKVGADYEGVVVRVSRNADGSREVSKVVNVK